MKRCKYCDVEQSESNFEVAAIVNGRAYGRQKCRACKQARQRERRLETYALSTDTVFNIKRHLNN